MKHLIWTSNINMKDWTDYCEEEGLDQDSDKAFDAVFEMNRLYLDDELVNCNVNTEHPLVIFADFGLWDGVRPMYFISSNNIAETFKKLIDQSATFNGDLEIAVEDGELVATIWHHDGTNSYTIRELKQNINEDELAELTCNQLRECTVPAGKYPAKVYGWVN